MKVKRLLALFVAMTQLSTLWLCMPALATAGDPGDPDTGAITWYEVEDATPTATDGWNNWQNTYTYDNGDPPVTIIANIQVYADRSRVFNVQATEGAGMYDVRVVYAVNHNEHYQFIVNDDTANPVDLYITPSGSWGDDVNKEGKPIGTNFTYRTIQVPLKAGANTLKLINTNDGKDNATSQTRFDKIGISKSKKYTGNITYSTPATAPDDPHTFLWYSQAAEAWRDSMPLGNGRIGAMVWGGIYNDTFSLNEVTAWSGEDHSEKNLDNTATGPDNVKKLQDLLTAMQDPNAPKSDEADITYRAINSQGNPQFGTQRPFGKLNINFAHGNGQVSNYIRKLDFSDSLATVSFTADGTAYTREAFVSNPDQVAVMNFQADKNEKITFSVAFDIEELRGGNGAMTRDDNDVNTLIWTGAVSGAGVSTYARLKAINTGGTVVVNDTGMHVSGANEVTLIAALGTDFGKGASKSAIDARKAVMVEKVKKQLTDASVKTYDALKTAHINDVKPKFDVMTFSVGDKGTNIPTNQRIDAIRDGQPVDGDFLSLLYNYARYLMLAGSREDSPLPMPLQALWNDNVACNMAWTNDYHLDINIEMNQWMSNAANLSEGEIPIFTFMRDYLIPSGENTAKQYVKEAKPGVDTIGWMAGVTANGWGYTGMTTADEGWDTWKGTTTLGAWLAQEIMSYFDHTWDKEWLRDEGFHMLKGASDFFLNLLVDYTYQGKTYKVAIPSSSPEHGRYEIMSTQDRVTIADIFTQVLRSYDLLDMSHDAYYNMVSEYLAALPPMDEFAITQGPTDNDKGYLKEWMFNDVANAEHSNNTAHRHTGHLNALFPYDDVTPDKNQAVAAAARKSVYGRLNNPGYEHTEWTAVNDQGFFARLKDGDGAYEYLELLCNTFMWPNLLSISPAGIAAADTDVYVIDGTFGIAQTSAEMFMQSHSSRIEFLPALPRLYPKGSISGMMARGAFELAFDWDDSRLTKAVIKSNVGNTASIYKNGALDWSNVKIFKKDGSNYTDVTVIDDNNMLTFDTIVDGVYEILKTDKSALSEINGNYAGKTFVNDDTPRALYSQDWTHDKNRKNNNFMDSSHVTTTQGATASFEFEGTGVAIVVEKGVGYGGFTAKIDGVEVGDTYSTEGTATDGKQVIVIKDDGLENTMHTLVITTTAAKTVAIDGFEIYNNGGIYFEDGDYTFASTDGNQLLIENNSAQTAPSIGALNQHWYIEKIADSPYSHIIHALTGKKLGVNDSGAVINDTDLFDGSQEWLIMDSYTRSDGEGLSHDKSEYVIIENRKSGQYLQSDAGGWGDGWGVSPYQFQRQPHFNWKIVEAQNGVVLFQVMGSGRYLEIDTSRVEPEEAVRARVNSLRTASIQGWTVTNNGDDTFSLLAKGTQLAISEDKTLKQFNSSDQGQIWILEESVHLGKKVYYFRNSNTDERLFDKKWALTPVDPERGTAAPIAINLNVGGAIVADRSVRFGFTYKNAASAPESTGEYKVYVVDSFNAALGTAVATGTISSSAPATITIPTGVSRDKVVVFEVTPKSTERNGVPTRIAVTHPSIRDNQLTSIIASNDFEQPVVDGQNGWRVSSNKGDPHIKNEESGNTGKSLGFIAPNDWYGSAYLSLNLEEAGYTLPSDKVYIGFSMKQSLSSNIGNWDPNSTSFIALKNAAGEKIVVIRQRDFAVDLIAPDTTIGTMGNNKLTNRRYNIANGKESIFNIWRDFGIYIDTTNKTYSVQVDGEFITTPLGINFPMAVNDNLGEVNAAIDATIKSIELGNEHFSWDCGIWLDNLEYGSYDTDPTISWSVRSVSAINPTPGQVNTFDMLVEKFDDITPNMVKLVLFDENDRMIDSADCGISFTGDLGSGSASLTIPADANKITVRALAWNSVGSLVPISKAYTYTWNK